MVAKETIFLMPGRSYIRLIGLFCVVRKVVPVGESLCLKVLGQLRSDDNVLQLPSIVAPPGGLLQ